MTFWSTYIQNVWITGLPRIRIKLVCRIYFQIYDCVEEDGGVTYIVSAKAMYLDMYEFFCQGCREGFLYWGGEEKFLKIITDWKCWKCKKKGFPFHYLRVLAFFLPAFSFFLRMQSADFGNLQYCQLAFTTRGSFPMATSFLLPSATVQLADRHLELFV